MRWVEQRAPFVRHLAFSACATLGPLSLGQQLSRLSAAGTRLRSVCLHGMAGSADASILALARCAGPLEAISLRCEAQGAGGRLLPLLASSSALAALSTLGTLRALCLSVDRVLGSTREAAAAFAPLTRLCLCCREEAAILAPELLTEVTALRRLELSNVRLAQVTPPLAAALARLEHLSCR